MEQIITATAIRELGRPIGQVAENQLNAYIVEVENMYVKPILGDDLYIKILSREEDDDTYDTLLYGGRYEDANGGVHLFTGLHVAMSYFVYAQNIMTGDFQSTRFGMVVKQNDYSNPLTGKERSDAYNNALEVGKRYLNECVAYCKAVGMISTRGRAVGTGSVTIKKIG